MHFLAMSNSNRIFKFLILCQRYGWNHSGKKIERGRGQRGGRRRGIGQSRMILFLSLDNSIQDHKVFLFQIGGRVKDVQFGGITVELGANWVHRLQNNVKNNHKW